MKTKQPTTVLILMLCCLAGMASAVKVADKPNVLFIAIDDLNDWTGMLQGNPQAKTPHMDKLASKGMLFTNAHCAAPACGPSRAAIMSGIRPCTSGNYINKSSFIHNPILNNSVLLPEFFQQNGYYVCGAGKLFHGYHFNEEVQGRGFDEYYPSKTQDLPSFDGLKFSSPLPLGGWGWPADWGPCRPDVTVDDHPDGITAIDWCITWDDEELAFDCSDEDGNGIPDDVQFLVNGDFTTAVDCTPEDPACRVRFSILDLALAMV